MRVMDSIKTFLEMKLKLKVNAEKSKVERPWNRKFLGYTFTPGENTRIKISKKSIDRLKEKIREITRKGRGRSLKKTIKELELLLRGWMNFFKLTEVPTIIDTLDKWIRRKIRKIIWIQMKTPRNRIREFKKRGIKNLEELKAAYTKKGPWRSAKSPLMQKAYPNSYLDSIGLVSLARIRFKLSS